MSHSRALTKDSVRSSGTSSSSILEGNFGNADESRKENVPAAFYDRFKLKKKV